MEKTKLLEMRKFKGFTQQQIADHLKYDRFELQQTRKRGGKS